MAKAPTPGKTEKEAAQRSSITITMPNGDSRTLYRADLGPADDLVSRQQTGFPVSNFFDEERFGMDSVLLLYWMACRKSGQPKLKFADVLKQYPSYEDLEGVDIEAEEEGGEEDDPLPSGEG